MTDFELCVRMARIAVAEPMRSPEYIFRPGYNDAALLGREFLRLAEKAGELRTPQQQQEWEDQETREGRFIS